MKLKKSYFFYLFVLVLSASVYYFDYYKGAKNEEKKDKDAILIPFLKDDIVQVELKSAAGDLDLVKTENIWMVKKPISDFAASDETTGWIQSLTTEKSTEKIGEGETFDWSTYGLDKPKATLIVTSSSGQKIQLQIAERKNFEGNPFIKKNEEKVVYIGSSVWPSLMEKSLQELRDKRLLREPLKDLEEVVITQGQKRAHFIMTEGKWIIKDKPTWRLDQNKVREVINSMAEMKSSEVILETQPTKEQLSTYGFSPSSLRFTYYLKGMKSFVFELTQDKTKQWIAWPYDLKRLVKVEGTAVQKLTKLELEELRDRELPFVFNKDDVKKLNIISDKKMELSKEGESWKSTTPGTIELTEVNDFLENLRQLRVAEFMDGKESVPGLETEKKRFTLTDGTGKNIFDLKIGSSFKKKEDKIETNFVYAKSSVYPDVIVLKEEDLANLTVDKLMKKDKPPEAKSEAQFPTPPATELGEAPQDDIHGHSHSVETQTQ